MDVREQDWRREKGEGTVALGRFLAIVTERLILQGSFRGSPRKRDGELCLFRSHSNGRTSHTASMALLACEHTSGEAVFVCCPLDTRDPWWGLRDLSSHPHSVSLSGSAVWCARCLPVGLTRALYIHRLWTNSSRRTSRTQNGQEKTSTSASGRCKRAECGRQWNSCRGGH